MAKFSTTDGSLELHMKCHNIIFILVDAVQLLSDWKPGAILIIFF